MLASRLSAVACFAVLVSTGFHPATAQDSVLDRVELRLGGATLDADSNVRVDDGVAVGTTIDFEDELGLEGETETFSVELTFRLGRRHQLGFSHQSLDRSGERRLDQNVTFQGFTFPFGVDTESYLDLELTGVAYTFWPVVSRGGGLGISLGAYQTDLAAGITGRATVGGVLLTHTEEASESAPLPFLGVEVRLAPSDRWRIFGRLRVLSIDDFDGWDGDLTDGNAGIELKLLPHLWIGAAYRVFELDVQLEEPGFSGRAVLDFSGLGAYATLTF